MSLKVVSFLLIFQSKTLYVQLINPMYATSTCLPISSLIKSSQYYFVKRINHEAPHANFKPPVATYLPGSTILSAVNLSYILVKRHGHMLSSHCSFSDQSPY
jgi:hypothetical protein